ncbi:MAG TPA: diguanylate cyclase [Xanthomonadaceae bacterium]|nr:diguanylate cyclase [Xanthomonadaceae bacterium]
MPTSPTIDESRPLAESWKAQLSACTDGIRQQLAEAADEPLDDYVDAFYADLLDDPRARQFLTHDQVRTTLKPALKRWLHAILKAGPDDVDALIGGNRHVGQVHARIGIPVDLVARGVRLLRQRLIRRFQADAAGDGPSALAVINHSIDIAMEAMSQAYARAQERSSRTDAAYRLFTLVQNVGAERERQRALLLDWENRLLYAWTTHTKTYQGEPLAGSEFGLWFLHKGVPSFGQCSETDSIQRLVGEIDAMLGNAGNEEYSGLDARLQAFEQIRERLATIRHLLTMLFERLGELDSGADALTQLLNRRFLPAVLRREIELSRQSAQPFAALLIDLDHFKQINDSHGHEAGDRALQHVAAVLANATRGSDYVFRLGGEEFVIVLVAVNEQQAMIIAEDLCRQIAAQPLVMPGKQSLSITASIGVAAHDGHPDYEHLMARADAAMYAAKQAGRNRCMAAGPGPDLSDRQPQERNAATR